MENDMNVHFTTLSLSLWLLAGGSTTGVLYALDIVGRLLGLSQRHLLLAALGVLTAEQSNDRGIELVSSVQELELHEEEVAHDLTTNLLDEVSTCNCGATCECVSLEIRQARHS
jgi:hypothetical protein